MRLYIYIYIYMVCRFHSDFKFIQFAIIIDPPFARNNNMSFGALIKTFKKQSSWARCAYTHKRIYAQTYTYSKSYTCTRKQLHTHAHTPSDPIETHVSPVRVCACVCWYTCGLKLYFSRGSLADDILWQYSGAPSGRFSSDRGHDDVHIFNIIQRIWPPPARLAIARSTDT